MELTNLKTKGDRLRYLRENVFKYYTARSFAIHLGIDPAQYDKAEKNQAWIKKSLSRLTDLGVNLEWLEHGYGNMLLNQVREEDFTTYSKKDGPEAGKKDGLKAIPLYDFVATAGLSEVFGSSEKIIGYIQVPNLDADGSIRITGDSMYSLLRAGDVVAYKRIHDIENGIFHGGIYLIAIQFEHDFMATVKFIHPSDRTDPDKDKYIKLVSYNENHADKEIHLKYVVGLARIVGSFRDHSMV